MVDFSEGRLLWFPGIYHGRDEPEFKQMAGDISLADLIELVQKRAQEDGEYCIANGFVGPNNENEPKMRRMMKFVSDPTNVEQCREHLIKQGALEETTVDWVCRDLANASKVMVR